MEIYILCDGKQLGPYDELTVRNLMQEGRVSETDFAWVAGMEAWAELRQVLPAAQPLPESQPSAEAVSAAELEVVAQTPEGQDPATQKQRAFLEFMGLQVGAGLTQGQAAIQVNRILELRQDPERIVLWNSERLRLHPELFVDEAAAALEQRPVRYLKEVEKEAGAFFPKVTKAHCQVLVKHLDTRFPDWEKHEDPLRRYFLPALVEKFPKLATSEGKRRFRSSDASASSAPVVVVASSAVRRDTPGRAAGRGVLFGVLLLGLLYGGQLGWARYRQAGDASAETDAGTASAGVASGESMPAESSKEVAAAAASPALAATGNSAASADAETKSEAKSGAKSGDGSEPAAAAAPAMNLAAVLSAEMAEKTADKVPESKPAEPAAPAAEAAPMAGAAATPAADGAPMAGAAAAPTPEGGPMAGAAGMAPAPAAPTPLFDAAPAAPGGGDAAMNGAPVPLPGADAAAGPKKSAVLKKATEVTLPLGKATIAAGTRLPVVSQEGASLKVRYGAEIITVLVADTDFADGAAGAAAPAAAPAAPMAPKPAGSLF